MGFALTILYLVTTYLGTETVFGPLAAYHVQLMIAFVVILISVPSLLRSFVLKTPQSLALIGLTMAVVFSVLVTGWAGGAVQSFQSFIPNAFPDFLVCLHCNSKRKLNILVFVLLFVCLFVIARGSIELRRFDGMIAANQSESFAGGHWSGDYLMGMKNSAGEWLFRLRGKGFINDPNDFAQLIVCVIPLTFVFWRPKRRLWNIFLVLLPACALLYGAFLTHSRGFLLAFLAIAVVAGRRRIGTVPSLIIAGGVYLVAFALHFTGGRDVSLDAGSDRTALWGGGMQLLKSHPLFGVGFGKLPDYLGLTAHNSIVVCAAELGLFGLFFWSLFLFPTLRDCLGMASVSTPQKEEAGAPTDLPMCDTKPTSKDLTPEDIIRFARLIVLSFTGFLVAGFFLSRAFVTTLFLLGGIAEAVYEMGLKRGIVCARWPLMRVLPWTGGLTIAMILSLYVMLRITNFMR